MKVWLALSVALILFISPAKAAQLSLPAVPHYELPSLALSQPAAPPRYTEHYNQGDAPRNAEDDKGEDRKSLWERITGDAVAFVTLCLTGVTGVLALSTVGLWIVTGVAGKRQARDMKQSLAIAKDAVNASIKALDHARETAHRDFRGWLTIQAALDSPVKADPSEEGCVSFFIKLSCTNVGREAAQNVVYIVRGIDLSIRKNLDEWFEQLIRDAVWQSEMTRPFEWKVEKDDLVDSLVPSETHADKLWCRVPGPDDDGQRHDEAPERHIFKLCVGIAVAYSSAGASSETFYTAKVFPVGIPNIPVFLDLIGAEQLPIEPDVAALGAARKAQAI